MNRGKTLTFSWQFMQRLSTCIIPVSSSLSTKSPGFWNCDSAFVSVDIVECEVGVEIKSTRRRNKRPADKTNVATRMYDIGSVER